ncbi:hypothetical protein GCM10028806_33510 [Spirosoma terrae]|uniref:Uncharacterized protein n=1 Tax=Spirosoma terrae TaxID=1968276 RepID=A0A6L9L537_9BACT|nr:hypothetical protein [Spirosoma terrae]NDU95666.1 hypothetical protein [Spirosoma terrae]
MSTLLEYENIVVPHPLAKALKQAGYADLTFFWYELIKETGAYRLMWPTPEARPHTHLSNASHRMYQGAKVEKVSAPTWDQAFALMRKCGWHGVTIYNSDIEGDDGHLYHNSIMDLDKEIEYNLNDDSWVLALQSDDFETQIICYDNVEEARYDLLRAMILHLDPTPILTYQEYLESISVPETA